MEEVGVPRDWPSILDAIYRINCATDVEAFQRESLSCLRYLIPFDQGIFYLLDSTGEGISRYSPYIIGPPARYIENFLTGTYDAESFFTSTNLRRQSHVSRDSDVVPDESRRTSTSLYRDIYLKEGFTYGLRAELCHEGEPLGAISILNSKASGDFTRRNIKTLDTIVPHMALRLSQIRSNRSTDSYRAGKQLSFASAYNLTERESQVVALLLAGVPVEEIAAKLCVTMSTVRKHIYNTYRKVGVNNKVQLITAFERFS